MPRSAAAVSLAVLLLAGCTGTHAGSRPQVEHFPAGGPTAEAARVGGFRLPFSAAVRIGDVLYLSGQIGTRADGTLPEGIEAQTRQTMDNVGAVLAQAGLGWRDVFRCLVMLDEMSQWQAFNRVYVTYFDPDRLPARSALGADGLALGALVEVECQAHAPERR
jgi:reactive intermediate/imine deaminase